MNKRIKKLVSLSIVATFLLSMTMVFPVHALDNWIAVDPPYYMGTALNEIFNLDINISVTNMYGYEFRLYWDNKLLECTGYTETPPAAWGSNWDPSGPGIEQDFNATHGRFWRAISARSPAVAFTGLATIVTLTFKVKYQPYFPEVKASCDIALGSVKFATPDPLPIIMTEYWGFYEIYSVPPPTPEIYLDPDEVWGVYGNNFTVDLMITDLAEALCFVYYQAFISYNTTHLDCLEVIEGPFLDAFKGPMGTDFAAKCNGDYYPPWSNRTWDDEGKVGIVGGLLDHGWDNPYGSGVLATMVFNATYQTVYPLEPLQTSYITIYDSTMLNCSAFIPEPSEIEHEVGPPVLYHVPYITAGRNIDCFTGHHRKKAPEQWTPYIGVGPNMPADAYEPQDLVTLYAYVTYNEEPVQYKLVEFEIHGPINSLYNLTIYRTAVTNQSGYAMIEFRIPMPCEPYTFEESLEIIFGEWVCYQAVDLACNKVEDWLFFKVGWIVEIIDITVTPEVAKNHNVTITIYYENIALTTVHTVFTFVVFDALGVPIGTFLVDMIVPASPVYCTPYNDTVTVEIYIPKWAFVGMGTVYANAYTNLPWDCGIPLCPEVSAEFTILRDL